MLSPFPAIMKVITHYWLYFCKLVTFYEYRDIKFDLSSCVFNQSEIEAAWTLENITPDWGPVDAASYPVHFARTFDISFLLQICFV